MGLGNMVKVKKIKQACVLACIESFLKDNGINIEQDCMISVLSNLGLCTTCGIVYDVPAVGKLFNIKITDITYHWPIDNIYENGSLLICTNEISRHCVRFFNQKDENKVTVMDPESGEYEDYTKEMLEKMKASFFKIELQATNI